MSLRDIVDAVRIGQTSPLTVLSFNSISTKRLLPLLTCFSVFQSEAPQFTSGKESDFKLFCPILPKTREIVLAPASADEENHCPCLFACKLATGFVFGKEETTL